MAGASGLGGDPALRTPMSWSASTAGFSSGAPFRAPSANIASANVAAQIADPNSILAFYKSMLALRNGYDSLRSGSYERNAVNGSVWSYQRRLGSETVLVAINYGASAATVALANLPASRTLAAAYPTGGSTLAADAGGNATLVIPAQSVRVFFDRP